VRGGTALGLRPVVAGRLVSELCFVGMVTIVWTVVARNCPRAVAYPLVLLAAAFPGSTYFQAVFPIALGAVAAVAAVAAVVLLGRRRPVAAGLAAAVGVVSYPSLVLLGALAVPVVWWADGRPRVLRRRFAEAAGFVVPVVAAYGAVLTTFRVTVGRWDAWFLIQAHYGYGDDNPIRLFLDRFRPLTDGSLDHLDGPAAQSVLVVVLVAIVVGVAVIHRREPDRLQHLAMVQVLVFWAAPLAIGGQLSVYRSEALLVPAVLALRRLPPVVLWPLTAGALVLAGVMDHLFFMYQLL
jgi:hypothetical protein